MQILGLIAVMSWIVMGAAAIEVSRALGKQVCIGRLFLLVSRCHFWRIQKQSNTKPAVRCIGVIVVTCFVFVVVPFGHLNTQQHTNAFYRLC